VFEGRRARCFARTKTRAVLDRKSARFAHNPATPLQIATRLGTVSFLSTTTIFGTPTDVTLSELALEMLFPADEPTVAIVKSMTDEDTQQPPGKVHLPRAG